MDASMATYLLIPVLLFLLLGIFIQWFRKPLPYRLYTGLILFLVLLLSVIDVSVFHAWGIRLDATPLKYVASPREAWASIQHLPLFWGTVLFILVYLSLLWLAGKLITKGINSLAPVTSKAGSLVILILLLASFIIPIRGGFQLSPINQSSVYFSPHNFANQAAINPTWNLMYSLNHSVENTTNVYAVMTLDSALHIRDSLYQRQGVNDLFVKPGLVKPNVILIIWESFTRKVIDAKRGGRFITPGFNALKNEGIYFSDMYATGDRTDKGLAGVLSGYPAQHDNSIIKLPAKAAKLPMLSKEFFGQGYETSFYYGGETEFANMKAYLVQGNYSNFVSINDFKKSDQNSKWGAHDEVVMNRMFRDLQQKTGPQFVTWLTLSSHEPFEVPANTVFPGKDEESLFLNSIHYSDSVINRFVQMCKAQPWWNNTLIIISPDHGKPIPRSVNKADDFKTSLLFLGGALARTGEVPALGSQVDIAATLLNQLHWSSAGFPWSRNLMDSTRLKWSYFVFNNGFGFVQPSGTIIYDNTGRQVIQHSGKISNLDDRAAKGLQQVIFQDYLDK